MKTTPRPLARGVKTGLLGALLVLAASACSDEPTEPEQTPEETRSAPGSAASVPWWLGAWYNALPPEAQQVWSDCRTAGTANESGTPYVVGVNCRLIDVDGYPRRYVVYVPNHPDIIQGLDVPLVVMYHGASGSGEQFYEMTAWREEADAEGFVVAYPSGLPYQILGGGRVTKWHRYGLADEIDPAWRPPGYRATAPWPADDSTFTLVLLDDVSGLLSIDTLRVHATGFSNGGAFVARLSIELYDRLASVASVTGPSATEYAPAGYVPAFHATGTVDPNPLAGINAWLDSLGLAQITELPLDPAAFFSYPQMDDRRIAAANTYDLEPDVYTTATDSTHTLMRWETPQIGNMSGNVFWWGILHGVAHEYPRGPGRRHSKNNPAGFDAPRAFYQFFQTHPR